MSNFEKDLQAVVEKTGVQFPFGRIKMRFLNVDRTESVDCLILTERAKNALKRSKIHTIGDLSDHLDTIAKVRGVGIGTVKDIKTRFVEHCYDRMNSDEKLEFWSYAVSEGGSVA